MNRKSIKVGLMGCGAVAQYGHLPTIDGTEGLELHAIFDPRSDSLEKIKERYSSVKIYSDSEAFFRSGVEAISITSPAPIHHSNVLDSAHYKLPVLCEKPLAMNEGEAREMISAMKEADCSLYTAFCYRFSPSALKIRELVRSGSIGDVRSLRLIYNWNLHGKFGKDEGGNQILNERRVGRMVEGGPMVDCGTHQIDLARFWLGSEVKSISSHGAWVDEYEAPDHLWLHMDHENGAHTMVEMSYSYTHTSRNRQSEFVYELIGSEGVIRYERSSQKFWMENTDGRTEFEFHHEKSFEGLYAEWERALRDGTSDLLSSAEDGLIAADIARRATDFAIEDRKRKQAK